MYKEFTKESGIIRGVFANHGAVAKAVEVKIQGKWYPITTEGLLAQGGIFPMDRWCGRNYQEMVHPSSDNRHGLVCYMECDVIRNTDTQIGFRFHYTPGESIPVAGGGAITCPGETITDVYYWFLQKTLLVSVITSVPGEFDPCDTDVVAWVASGTHPRWLKDPFDTGVYPTLTFLANNQPHMDPNLMIVANCHPISFADGGPFANGQQLDNGMDSPYAGCHRKRVMEWPEWLRISANDTRNNCPITLVWCESGQDACSAEMQSGLPGAHDLMNINGPVYVNGGLVGLTRGTSHQITHGYAFHVLNK